MSTAPIKREEQIVLMKSYQERRASVFKEIVNDPLVRASLFENSVKPEEGYRREDRKVSRCG